MKLTRWKLVYIFLFIFLIFQTNMVLANNIVVPHEWYRYQGANDSDKKGNDCGPACVAMAIQFIKNTFVPIRDIRNYIGPNTATSEQLKNSLQHWGISYNHLSAGSQNVIDAVNNRNHIVICPVKMLCFSPGLDIDSESDDDPALHYDRYCSFTEERQGHFIVVKGISDDGNWIIVYDPGVWGSYPYPKYWYSNREPKGKERYYKLSEFSNAINSRGIEILPEPHPIITSPLKITPDPPYYVGDTINTEFTITNQSSLPIKFSVLTVGGRDPDNHVSDFTLRQNITLEPSKSYSYQGTLTLNKVGDHHFFCTYQTPDGEWNTNVDLGSGLTDEDRTEEIVVIVKKTEKAAVYLTDMNNHRIQKFTSDGKFITKWGKEGNGDGEFDCPTGITVDSQDNVYVADGNNHRIQKFTSDGKFITKWGKKGNGNGEFICPVGISVDSQDNVYVADWNNHRIQKFTSEGGFVTKWGKEGVGIGNFRDPMGISVDSQDNVYVADWNNHCIQKFTSEGKLITKWEWDKGDIDGGEFDCPTGIAVDSQDNVYVVNVGNYEIQKFTSDGKFITKWGKEGNGNGEFDYPEGITLDSQDNVYVADGNNHRIQKFTSEGEFITKWGKKGNGDGEFDYPMRIVISRIDETEELEEKEKEISPYHVEYKPIVSADIFANLLVNVSGPADELGIILTNPEGWSTTRFISKRDLIDNFESVKVSLCKEENPPSGTYNLTIKTITPEKTVYQKEIRFSPPVLEITDAEIRIIKTEGSLLGRSYVGRGHYLTDVDIVVKNWGDLPLFLRRIVITLRGRKTQEMSLDQFKGVPYGETKIKEGGIRGTYLWNFDEDIFDSAVIKLYSFSEEDCIAEYQARIRFDYYDSIWDYE